MKAGIRRLRFFLGRRLQLAPVGLGLGGGQKSLQDFHPRPGEPARGGQLKLRGQFLHVPLQYADRIGMPQKPR